MSKIIITFFLLSLFFSFHQAAIDNCLVSLTTTGGSDTCVRCASGYSQTQNGLCIEEITNCFEYQDESKLLCKTCVQNYVKSFNSKACVPPIGNCTIHTDGTNSDTQKCAQCASGFAPTFGGKACVRSSTTGCNRYNSFGNCTEIKGCKTYDTTNPLQIKCTACFEDLSITTSGLNCVPKITDCSKYEEDGTCRACSSESKTLSNTRRACFPAETTCAEINDFGLCVRCVTPTKVPVIKRLADCITSPCSSKCVPPKANCTIYADDETCIRCSLGQTLYSGACYLPINQCIKYDATNGKCTECISNYDLDQKENSIGSFCVPTITSCTLYLPNGVCRKCETGKRLVVNPAVGTALSESACVTADDNCVAYDIKGCTRCQLYYDIYKGKCYKRIANCISYDSTGCQSCATDFNGYNSVGNSAVPYVKCFAQIIGCSTQSGTTGLCTACTSELTVTGSGKSCVTAITTCAQYDDVTKSCLDCGATSTPTKNGKKCGTAITDCDYLDDTDATLCAVCKAGKVPASDRKSCVTDLAVASSIAPVSNLFGGGQITVTTGGKTYCLTHQVGTLLGGLTTLDLDKTPLTDAQKEVAFKNCDDENYLNTLWQFMKDDGTVVTTISDLNVANNLGVSLAVFYPGGTENSIPVTLSTFAQTKLHLRLKTTFSSTTNALASTNTMVLSFEIFTTFTASSETPTIQGPFNPQLKLLIKGSKKLIITAVDTWTFEDEINVPQPQTSQKGYLLFNSLTPTGSAKTYTFNTAASATATSLLDFRQVFLDATATSDRTKIGKLSDQVSMKYTINDDRIVFEWGLASGSPLIDLSNVFPAVIGETLTNATDRVSLINNVCNFRYGQDVVDSGWKKGLETAASFKKIVFNIPVFDLSSKCGFTYTTTTTAGAADKGITYIKGRVGFYTAATTASNFDGDGIFDAVTFKLGNMKNERSLYLDNPAGYSWYKRSAVDFDLRFNAVIRFFAGPKELADYQSASDARGLIIPAGNSSNTGLQGKLNLVSFELNDVAPTEMTAASLDRNVRTYKDLTENLTISSVILKLVKTVTIDASTSAKYFTKVPISNLKMSTTEKNTALFDVDLRSVVSGTYSLVTEYQVLVPRLTATKARILVANENASEKLASIKKAEEENEEIMTMTGTLLPLNIEYQSNYENRMVTLLELLAVLIMAWI